MALNSFIISNIIYVNLSSMGILGSATPQLSDGLADGLVDYATDSITVQSIDTGTAGSGVGTGFGVILSPTIYLAMNGSFIANGIIGVFSPSMATAIASAFIQSFALASISTNSVGVGVGAGVAAMIPVPGVSTGIFLAALNSAGVNGPNVPQLASAVATGLDIALLTSFAPVIIAGPPSPIPSAGTGFGRLS
jgi:hypothetical protein